MTQRAKASKPSELKPSGQKEQQADEVKVMPGAFYRDPKGKLFHADDAGVVAVESVAFKARVSVAVGVNRKHKDFGERLAEAEDMAEQFATTARVAHCSAFDRDGKRFFVNLGAGYIIEISKRGRRKVPNGVGGVLFVDEQGFEPIDPKALERYAGKDARALKEFRRNVLDFPPPAVLTRPEAEALGLATWIGFFFDREFARGRPLLLFVGPIGSGKTMCARKLGCAYYGHAFEVSVSAAQDRGVKDLAAAVAHTTLTVRDDLNAAPSGLVELLLCVATGAQFELSRFHETLAREQIPMRGSVVFTATSPKWAKRQDLLSRLVIVQVKRDDRLRETEETEEDRLARAYRSRAAGWHLVLVALQRIVASSEQPATLTRFRSWEQGVRRALRAFGPEDDLVAALQKMGAERTELALRADPFLGMLQAVARKHPQREWTAADLNDALARSAGMQRGPNAPHVARPHDARELGKLLEHIEQDGATVVRVERVGKAHGNVAKWRITPLDHEAEGARATDPIGATAPAGGNGGMGGSRSPTSSLRKKKRRGKGSSPPLAPPRPPAAPSRPGDPGRSRRWPRRGGRGGQPATRPSPRKQHRDDARR
jgi:hypothetical protein